MADNLNVVIVGAGLGGLLLGLCLERAKIDYVIVEKATKIRPLGSAISLGATIAPIFTQLGILEDMQKASKQLCRTDIYTEDMKTVGTMDTLCNVPRYGWSSHILERSELYRILLERIPSSKIHLGRRVLKVMQDDEWASVKCANSKVFKAHIVVGADGAYSAVRQCIYKDLQSEGRLPSSDNLPLSYTSSSLVGTTELLSEDKYPQLKEGHAYMDIMMGDGRPYIWCLFTVHGKICWMVIKDLKRSNKEEMDLFRSSEWSNESAQEFADEVRDFPTPFGGTLGDLFDQTDPKLISKVLLEEKMFDTWYDQRTVLIGDACHKMSPYAGQGAIQAFLDAASLAGHLNDLEDLSLKSITHAFKLYKSERFSVAKRAVNLSRTFASLFDSKSTKDVIIRELMLKWIPDWMANVSKDKIRGVKPQLTFLPFIPDQGIIKNIIPQKQSKRIFPALQTVETV